MNLTSLQSRRQLLKASAGIIFSASVASNIFAEESEPTRPVTEMGLVIYCRKIKRASMKKSAKSVDLYHPLRFLDECIALGVGGIQAELDSLTDKDADLLRERSTKAGMFVETIIKLPNSDEELERFEHDVRIARRAGAGVARTTIIPGRRYEQFKSLAEFREYEKKGEQSIRRAIPALERHKLAIGIENHKDQRNDERLKLFERIDNEFVGACVDTGNSIALLEDALETVNAFAPWAKCVHLKDQALQRTADGFLLSDVPLGEGCLPLQEMIDLVKKEQPAARVSLEFITRDPLLVPCLTDSYFQVFDKLPARDLARTLAFVERHADDSLPYVSKLSAEQQLVREDRNLSDSIRYAATNLRFGGNVSQRQEENQ